MVSVQKRAMNVGVACCAFGIVIGATALGEPTPDLSQNAVWFDMATGDRSAVKREPDDMVRFIAQLGMARCNAGDLAGATAIADELVHDSRVASTPVFGVFDTLSAAALYDAAGHPEMARKILQSLEKQMISLQPGPNEVGIITAGSIPEDYVLENIVIRNAIMGDDKHAIELAGKIGMTMTRQSARCELAHQLFIHDHKDEATQQLELVIDAANREKSSEDRSEMFDEVSRELSREADFDSAFKYAQLTTDSFHRMQSLGTVIVDMYKAGQAPGSRDKAEQVWKILAAGPANEHFDTLDSLAVDQLDEAVDVQGAAKTVAQMEGLPAGEITPTQQQELFYLKARIAAASGDVAECQRQTNAAKSVVIPEAHKEDFPWSESEREMAYIAQAYCVSGKFDEAMSAAKDAGNGDGYYNVIAAMINRGMITQAIALLPKIDSRITRGVEGKRIARQGVKSGKRAEVYDWIKSINEKELRAQVELGACEGLAKTDRSFEIVNPPVMIGF
jgi:hypothetical protein